MFRPLFLRAAAVVASLIFLALPALSAEFVVNGSRQGDAFITNVPIRTSYGVNDFSQPIQSCENMTVYWERGNSAQVTAYPADSDDDTVAEIEANAPIKTFTTNEHFGPFTPSKRFVRFVVDTVNASVQSSAIVMCSNQAVASSGGIPGLVGDTGNDETLSYLYTLRGFQAVSEQLTTTVYVDPYYGNDVTGDGSYAAPYFSFAKIKTTCWSVPHSKCVVKGRNRWFTHTLLTLAYTGAGGTRPLQVGETVTFSTPAGTAEVLWAEGNLAAVTWLSGADPRVNGATTFSAGSGESQGSVTAVRDSINGFPARVIAATDITTATDVIAGTAGTGHSYSNQAGPFKWYNQTTLPTTTGSVLVEYSTDVYICNVVAGVSFQVSTSPTCASVIDFTSQGTGSNQIIAGGDTAGLRKAIDISCTDNSRLCTLFTSEFPDAPWGLDSGKLAGDGAYYVEANTVRWPDGTIGGGPGTYNTPTGGLFMGLAAVQNPFTHGWAGVENGVIQNLGDDCFFAGGGTKIIALRVRCGVVNGTGDRSQNGANPRYQAHSSVASVTGTNAVDATAAAGVLILINADGSVSQMGSDSGSGGFLNPNENGILRFFSAGTMKYDGISGATDCTVVDMVGIPCSSPFVVQPSGDALVVGPHIIMGGNSRWDRLISTTGGAARSVFAKTVVDSRGIKTTASNVSNDPAFIAYAGGVQNTTKTILGYNVTFRATGPHNFLSGCPLQGTSAATANSRLNLIFDNTVMEWIGNPSSFRVNVADCAKAGYTDADAVARAVVKFRGVWDVDDDNPGCSGPCFFYDISSRPIGSCGTANTFLNDVCTATDSAGNNTPDDAWEWFTVNSADSGGVGVDGLQWATTDPQLRCADSTKQCYGLTNVKTPTYTLDLKDYWYGTDIGCLPADVLGKQVCAFNLKAVHAGAR